MLWPVKSRTMMRWLPAVSSAHVTSIAPVGVQTLVPLGRTTSIMAVSVGVLPVSDDAHAQLLRGGGGVVGEAVQLRAGW